MTWEELMELLEQMGKDLDVKVHTVREGRNSVVAMHFVPVAWFVSMQFTGALNIGVYEGEQNRLVGKEQIPLAELTPAFVRERVERASAEHFGLLLDPRAVSEFLERFPRPQLRDIEGAS